jgi:valyl-tRNA synthetase
MIDMPIKIREKRWDKKFEKPIYELWKEKKVYAFDKKSEKPIFSIDTPPPYVNTPVHVGHATTYVLMDMFARFRRMTGWNVLFPLGLDRNGLPIEMAAEKKFKVKLTKLPREKALQLCESILQESSMASTETFLRSGISFNKWELGKEIGDVYYTDSPEYRSLTQETFIDLWTKGLIYEDSRITNFCPVCQTTIADAEVEYADLPAVFNDVVFTVKETGEKIIIGTTRPELICTCGMVIYNPADKRYKHLEGKTAVTPVFEKEVPIKAHPMAEMEKGTGLVMMCSAGDLSDIRFFREMKLKPVIAINKDGTMNGHAGFLKGLPVEEARKKMVEELKKRGLLVKQTKTIHRTPICERSKDPIEFIAMPEFYLKQMEFKPKMRLFAKQINFFAPKSRQILLDWIDSVSIDWPVSRRRYYATEIPLWYCKKCGEAIVPPKGRYYRPWKEKPPVKKCPECGSGEFRGEDRVFDTWFDSSISPLYILKYSRDNEFFERAFPCTLRPSGKEIIRNWGYYTILRCYQLTGRRIFRDYWVNYHVVDEKGKKMSKSLGNVIDPKDILDRFGAEPFRLWAAVEGNLTQTDFRCSFERIEGEAKFLTKLWNVARFISQFEGAGKPKRLDEADKLILKELNKLVKYTRNCYEKYDFHNPTIRIRNFIWELFASHYLELVKTRAYNHEGKFTGEEQKSAVYTLNLVLETVLKLLAPVLPFITYKIYMELKGKDIHFEGFPGADKDVSKLKVSFSAEELMGLNSSIWKAKKDKGVSLRSEVKRAVVPDKFKSIGKDLRAAHNIKELEFGEELKVEI